MKTYEISVGRPLPSMSRDFHEITVETYQDAKDAAQEIWRETGMSVGVHSGGCRTYFWYSIDRDGNTLDRNCREYKVEQLV